MDGAVRPGTRTANSLRYGPRVDARRAGGGAAPPPARSPARSAERRDVAQPVRPERGEVDRRGQRAQRLVGADVARAPSRAGCPARARAGSSRTRASRRGRASCPRAGRGSGAPAPSVHARMPGTGPPYWSGMPERLALAGRDVGAVLRRAAPGRRARPARRRPRTARRPRGRVARSRPSARAARRSSAGREHPGHRAVGIRRAARSSAARSVVRGRARRRPAGSSSTVSARAREVRRERRRGSAGGRRG